MARTKRLRPGQIPFAFTPIPNTILDGWLRRITPVEYAVHSCVVRMTWGYRKREDTVSRSQIVEMSGLSLSTVKRALETLQEKGLLQITGSVKHPRIYEALMPRWADPERVTHDPTAILERVAGEPSVGSPMTHSKERKKAGPVRVK